MSLAHKALFCISLVNFRADIKSELEKGLLEKNTFLYSTARASDNDFLLFCSWQATNNTAEYKEWVLEGQKQQLPCTVFEASNLLKLVFTIPDNNDVVDVLIAKRTN